MLFFRTFSTAPKALSSAMASLGLKGEITDEMVKSAFLKLAKKFHPDSTELKDKDYAKTKFQEITEARDMLLESNKIRIVDPNIDFEEIKKAKYEKDHFSRARNR
jgi:DnaJ-class molecular chaperone